MTSRHWQRDRQERTRIIGKIGTGKIVKTTIVDRGHPNGPELHKITSTGLIMIYNQWTGKMITILIARPAQIQRYFKQGQAPAYIMELAREHERMGYNK